MAEKDAFVTDVLAKVLPCVSAHLRAAVADQIPGLLHYTAETPCEDPSREKPLIHQGTYRLLRLLSNLTNAQLLESDEMFLLRNEDIAAWFDDCCRQAEALFSTAGVRLVWETPLRQKIIGFSPEKLEIALYHLLSNALKFTPAGGTVAASLRESAGHVLLTVSDTGCGIPPELMDIVFERYLHPERTDPAVHGLGLGLATSRQIALRHGGRLLLDTKVGQGTAVTLSLPDKRVMHDEISELRYDYLGGFSHVHVSLSDALPPEAFTDAYLDR